MVRPLPLAIGGRTMVRVGEPPRVLLAFTALVCAGIMANFTLVVPVSTYYSSSLLDSGAIVASKLAALGSRRDAAAENERSIERPFRSRG